MLNELLKNIRDYVNGHMTLEGLEQWLVSNLQRILDSDDDEAITIANQLDADFVEFNESVIDIQTLQNTLLSLIASHDSIIVEDPEAQPSICTADNAIATVINADFRDQATVVDLGVLKFA
jgi:hypothetical protein